MSSTSTANRAVGRHRKELESSLRSLRSASPELIRERALLRRTDTKFTVPLGKAAELLAGLSDSYRLLVSNRQVCADYETLYFDDDDLSSFYAHQRGRVPRFKVRIRRYLDRRLSFLEIKRELDDGIREKHRWEIPYGTTTLSPSDMARLRAVESTLPKALGPRLWTNFGRATLLSEVSEERVTVDTRVVFSNEINSHAITRLAIVEVKQATFCERTAVMRALAGLGALPRPFSKYCTATHLLNRSKKDWAQNYEA